MPPADEKAINDATKPWKESCASQTMAATVTIGSVCSYSVLSPLSYSLFSIFNIFSFFLGSLLTQSRRDKELISPWMLVDIQPFSTVDAA
jgi:hypothetical protein